jgi:hypothetical protein
MAVLPNLQLIHLLDNSLIECINNRHLNFAASGQAPNRAGREAFLIAIGLTPADCFAATGIVNIPAQQQHVNIAPAPKIQLKPQQGRESVDDFLDRASDYMRVSNLTNAHQVLALQNAINEEPQLTIHQLITEGVNVYADIVTGLKNRYATPKFAVMDQYLSVQRLPHQSVCSFAQRLRSLFVRYIGLQGAQLAVHEPVIKQVLLARILPTLAPSIRVQTQALYDAEPLLALEVLLARVDGFCSYSTMATVQQSNQSARNNTRSNQIKKCANHPFSKSHFTKDCFLTQDSEKAPASSSSHRRSALRFRPGAGQPATGVCAAIDDHKSEQSENSD